MVKDKDVEWDDFSGAPNKLYERFFKELSEIDSVKVIDWKPKHVVGYFAKRYHNLYKVPYKFRCNSKAPSKCMEIVKVKTIQYRLSSDPLIIKNYIDWVFDEKIIKNNKRITSISFLTSENFIEDYKFNIYPSINIGGSVSRSSKLPENILNILVKHNKNISNYGQLSFLYQSLSNDKSLNSLFNEIRDTGFDLSILEEVV